MTIYEAGYKVIYVMDIINVLGYHGLRLYALICRSDTKEWDQLLDPHFF